MPVLPFGRKKIDKNGTAAPQIKKGTTKDQRIYQNVRQNHMTDLYTNVVNRLIPLFHMIPFYL